MQRGEFSQQNVTSKLDSNQGTVINSPAHDLLISKRKIFLFFWVPSDSSKD